MYSSTQVLLQVATAAVCQQPFFLEISRGQLNNNILILHTVIEVHARARMHAYGCCSRVQVCRYPVPRGERDRERAQAAGAAGLGR